MNKRQLNSLRTKFWKSFTNDDDSAEPKNPVCSQLQTLVVKAGEPVESIKDRVSLYLSELNSTPNPDAISHLNVFFINSKDVNLLDEKDKDFFAQNDIGIVVKSDSSLTVEQEIEKLEREFEQDMREIDLQFETPSFQQ